MVEADPFVSATLYVLPSTVNTTVPAGVIVVPVAPVTVAVSVIVCPYTRDAGEKAPSVVVEEGAPAGPVSVSSTDDGALSAALDKLPLNTTVSVVLEYVAGV